MTVSWPTQCHGKLLEQYRRAGHLQRLRTGLSLLAQAVESTGGRRSVWRNGLVLAQHEGAYILATVCKSEVSEGPRAARSPTQDDQARTTFNSSYHPLSDGHHYRRSGLTASTLGSSKQDEAIFAGGHAGQLPAVKIPGTSAALGVRCGHAA